MSSAEMRLIQIYLPYKFLSLKGCLKYQDGCNDRCHNLEVRDNELTFQAVSLVFVIIFSACIMIMYF